MDCWGFASDESLSTVGKDQIGSMGCEVKPPYIFGNNMGLFPNEINTENQVFGDMGFPPFSQENESNCGIDLKLGAQTFNPTHNLSGSEVSMPSKRPLETGSSTPFCKVLGCNKNLSNCKEYHKRHKVCELHSKTSKVIVNGIEQRFCQQCSRFHLLREFDDGKRSCRKRLAGHNERRRKPQVGPFSERHGRLLPSYTISGEGNEFKRSTGAISSFVIPYDHRIPYQPKYETSGRWQMNLEDRTAHDLQSISCITDERLHSKSLSPCYFETNPRFDGIVNGYIGASSSESAHSLLSYQSQNTSCYSSRIQTSNSHSQHPMLFHYEPNKDSVPLHQHGLNPMLGVEGSLVKFGIMSSDDQVFPDQGGTIDLLQLSSQLERVEHKKKRNSQVNPANGVGVDVDLGIS